MAAVSGITLRRCREREGSGVRERMKRFIKEQLWRREKTEDCQVAAALTGVIICLERPLPGNPAEYGKDKVKQKEPFLHHLKAFTSLSLSRAPPHCPTCSASSLDGPQTLDISAEFLSSVRQGALHIKSHH